MNEKLIRKHKIDVDLDKGCKDYWMIDDVNTAHYEEREEVVNKATPTTVYLEQVSRPLRYVFEYEVRADTMEEDEDEYDFNHYLASFVNKDDAMEYAKWLFYQYFDTARTFWVIVNEDE